MDAKSDVQTVAAASPEDSAQDREWEAPGICGALWHVFRTQWFFLVNYLFGDWMRRVKDSSKYHHKVLVIGDSLAAGFGDYTTCIENPGVTRHLREHVHQAASVRQRWTFLNQGVYGSTSEDWLPESKYKKDSVRSYGRFWGLVDRVTRRSSKSLWRDVFENPRYKDAEVVILCVGVNDSKFSSSPEDPKFTATNIKSICEELLSLDKQVLLCTIPLRWRLKDRPKPENKLFVDDRERNDLIAQIVSELKDKRLALGAHLGSLAYCRPSLYCADALHFNSDGYKSWARELRDVIIPAMSRVEAKTWKSMI